MQNTPKGLRIQIGIYGRRNVGKSSVLNAITKQQVSIVSNIAGTTTDPVEKAMEILPLGPVLFIDTAGIDDVGQLGKIRIEKTKKTFERTDLAIIVIEANFWGEYEEKIFNELKTINIPIIIVLNKIDILQVSPEIIENIKQKNINYVFFSAINLKGIDELRQAILDTSPSHLLNNTVILGDLISSGEIVIHVIPIDNEAPKGRLLLPQHLAIRDTLDHDAIAIVIKESQLANTLDSLKSKPKLVVTDSSMFSYVKTIVPKDILLTGYSILFARMKGDLITLVKNTLTIDRLKPGDKILISEACTHHPIGEDIGRVKVPNSLQKYLGFSLKVDIVQGNTYPQNLSEYKLVIQCGSCMFNRKEMLNRILNCQKLNVPITNYGLVFAYVNNIFDRALEPFNDAFNVYKLNKRNII